MPRLSLLAERHPLASPQSQRDLLRRLPLPRDFAAQVHESGTGDALRAARVDVLQVNLGKKCNQACHHCHVDAGPDRNETMSDAVMDAVLAVLARTSASTLDITGGAPELHPRFEELVRAGARAGKHILDRCNLTILTVPKYRHLPAFLAAHGVEVVASLPCYTEGFTDGQRGDGVYDKSIRALHALQEVGYGKEGSGLVLTLVANPVSATLSSPQDRLEAAFRRELAARHGLSFTRLYTLTNMPISRTLERLEREGDTLRYLRLLADSFNAAAMPGLMCRHTLSVSHEGALHDCDFNQMLALPVARDVPDTVFAWAQRLEDENARAGELSRVEAELGRRAIAVENHCFGCTAGQGSSCGGALA